MADSITSDNYLSMSLEYNDTETNKAKSLAIKVPNPKNNITESQIKTAMNTFINQQIILDPFGNAFSTTALTTASTVTEQKIKLDVGWNG